MKAFFHDTMVNAPPETIWHLLTDAAGYSRWHPEFTTVIGTIAAGENVTLLRETAPKEAVVKVTSLDPQHRMVMTSSGGLPAALLTVERTVLLSCIEAGAVRVCQRLEFSGTMAETVLKSVPDQQSILERIGEALKKAAEAR